MTWRLSRCHRERERRGRTAEMEVGGAGLLEAENQNGERAERGGRKLKWANGKGKCKIGYLYLGFVRVF